MGDLVVGASAVWVCLRGTNRSRESVCVCVWGDASFTLAGLRCVSDVVNFFRPTHQKTHSEVHGGGSPLCAQCVIIITTIGSIKGPALRLLLLLHGH